LDQGKEVEMLAREFLAGYLGEEGIELALTYERTFIDAHYANLIKMNCVKRIS
jgi:hypothetical protein